MSSRTHRLSPSPQSAMTSLTFHTLQKNPTALVSPSSSLKMTNAFSPRNNTLDVAMKRRGSVTTASTEDSTSHHDDATLTSHQSSLSSGSTALASKKPNFTMVVSKPHRVARGGAPTLSKQQPQHCQRTNLSGSVQDILKRSPGSSAKRSDEVAWWEENAEQGETSEKAPSNNNTALSSHDNEKKIKTNNNKKKIMTKVKASDLANFDLSQFRTKDGRPMDVKAIQEAMALMLASQEQSGSVMRPERLSSRRSSNSDVDQVQRRSRSKSTKSPRRGSLDSSNQAAQDKHHQEEEAARKRSKSVLRENRTSARDSDDLVRKGRVGNGTEVRRSRSTIRQRQSPMENRDEEQQKERSRSKSRARSKSRSPRTSERRPKEEVHDTSSCRKTLDRKSSNIAQRRARSRSRARTVKDPASQSFEDDWDAFGDPSPKE